LPSCQENGWSIHGVSYKIHSNHNTILSLWNSQFFTAAGFSADSLQIQTILTICEVNLGGRLPYPVNLILIVSFVFKIQSLPGRTARRLGCE